MSTEQNERDKKTIADLKEHIYWEPGSPPSVTIDGSFYLEDLKTIVRFMENGGPGKGGCKHEEL